MWHPRERPSQVSRNINNFGETTYPTSKVLFPHWPPMRLERSEKNNQQKMEQNKL